MKTSNRPSNRSTDRMVEDREVMVRTCINHARSPRSFSAPALTPHTRDADTARSMRCVIASYRAATRTQSITWLRELENTSWKTGEWRADRLVTLSGGHLSARAEIRWRWGAKPVVVGELVIPPRDSSSGMFACQEIFELRGLSNARANISTHGGDRGCPPACRSGGLRGYFSKRRASAFAEVRPCWRRAADRQRDGGSFGAVGQSDKADGRSCGPGASSALALTTRDFPSNHLPVRPEIFLAPKTFARSA